MGNRTLKMALLLLIPLLVLFCGTTFALMLRQTEALDNQFKAAVVDCDVDETVSNNAKISITVTNTGNIDAYLRVRLVSYWVDSHGNIVSKPSRNLAVTPAASWIQGSDNTYYYSLPVAPEDCTSNLLSENTNLPLAEEDGYRQVIEVFADAIQSKPSAAVKDSWNVTLDNGKIKDAP